MTDTSDERMAQLREVYASYPPRDIDDLLTKVAELERGRWYAHPDDANPRTWVAEAQRLFAVKEDQCARIDELQENSITDAGIIAELEARLPAEMSHCSIRFVECEAGHGRLTASNWVDEGCNRCRIVGLEASVIDACRTTGERTAALFEERERIAKQAKVIEQLRSIIKQAQKELAPLRRLDRKVRDLLDGRCVPGVCLVEDELRDHVAY